MHPVRVLVTGSSALRIEAGRDSLAGRISTIEMGPLLLREIAQLRGFGTLSALLPPNGLAPLKHQHFWQEVRAFGAHHTVIRQLAFAAFAERGGGDTTRPSWRKSSASPVIASGRSHRRSCTLLLMH